MMATTGVKRLKKYSVGLTNNGFEVFRTIEVEGYSKREVIDKLNIRFFNDDEVVGFQIKEVK